MMGDGLKNRLTTADLSREELNIVVMTFSALTSFVADMVEGEESLGSLLNRMINVEAQLKIELRQRAS